jgi:hypothetical protein
MTPERPGGRGSAADRWRRTAALSVAAAALVIAAFLWDGPPDAGSAQHGAAQHGAAQHGAAQHAATEGRPASGDTGHQHGGGGPLTLALVAANAALAAVVLTMLLRRPVHVRRPTGEGMSPGTDLG